jgi:hypothetical protein
MFDSVLHFSREFLAVISSLMLVVACSLSTPKLSGPARAYADAEERNVSRRRAA